MVLSDGPIMRSAIRVRIRATSLGEGFGLRPARLPWARVDVSPSRVRFAIRLRSNSASAESRRKTRRLVALFICSQLPFERRRLLDAILDGKPPFPPLTKSESEASKKQPFVNHDFPALSNALHSANRRRASSGEASESPGGGKSPSTLARFDGYGRRFPASRPHAAATDSAPTSAISQSRTRWSL